MTKFTLNIFDVYFYIFVLSSMGLVYVFKYHHLQYLNTDDAILVLRHLVPRRRSGIHMIWLEIDLHENTCINFNTEAPLIILKKKIQDKVVACVILEILKKIKYTYFSIFPYARSELFCNAKERFFDRALKTVYVYGFIKNKNLPFVSIMIHAYDKLLKWFLSCFPVTIFTNILQFLF